LLIVFNVSLKLLQRLPQFLRTIARDGLIFEIHFQMLDPLQRFKHISMPQVSLDALQLFQCTGPRLGFFGAEAFRHLVHHRLTHTHVKPVEQVFGLGIQIELRRCAGRVKADPAGFLS
jgi:hypothetical protein